MAVPTYYMTEDEYLAFERASDMKHEYVNGYVYGMVGAKVRHELVVTNCFRVIDQHLKSTGCTAFVGNMKLKLQASNSYYYPDILVSCQRLDLDDDIVDQAVLVIEVLSATTKSTDLREKRVAYQKMPNLIEYIAIHSDRQQVELHSRDDRSNWIVTTIRPPEVVPVISLPSGPFHLTFEMLYAGFDPMPPIRVKETEEEYSV